MQPSRRAILIYKAPLNHTLFRNATSNATVNVQEETQVRSWREIPGPSSLPLIGPLLHFLPGGHLSNINDIQENLYKKYGPIARIDGTLRGKPIIFLSDPESCAHILRGENWMPKRPGFESLDYYRKIYNKTKEQSKLPTGLITDHGENWKSFRTTVNPVMLQPKVVKLYSSAVDEVSQDMIKRMKSLRDESNKIKTKFDTEMNLWALESIGVIAFGGRLNCLNSDLPENSPERRLIQSVHDIFQIGNELDFKPNLWRYFSTRKFKRGMKIYEEQENLAKHFIRKARKEMLASKKPDDEKSILEKLLEIDERVAVIMACDMLFAGVDTAATTVTAALYLLATNPDKQEKLRQEISSDIETSKYLKACVKETLRLWPVVSGNLRETTKEYNVLGYKIPKDTMIVFNHMFMSKMDSQFAKAKEFIPERWIEKDELSYKNAHPFTYSPFGFGVRMCIGRRIAELEIETFLARLIQNFKVEWSGPPPTIKPSSLNYIEGPFNFTFKDVK